VKTLLFLAMPVLITACASNSSPGAVAQRYQRAYYQLNGAELQSLVTLSEQKAYTTTSMLEKALSNQLFEASVTVTRQIFERSQVKVAGVTQEEDNAIVTLNNSVPDLSETGSAVLLTGLAAAFTRSNDKDLQKAEQEILTLAKKAPLKKVTTTLKLVRENGAWKVVPGWAAQVKRESIASLTSDYEDQRERGDFKGAYTSLKELVALQPNDEGYKTDLTTFGGILKEIKQIKLSETTGSLQRGEFEFETKIENPYNEDIHTVYLHLTLKNGTETVSEQYRAFEQGFLEPPVVSAKSERSLTGTITPPENWTGQDYTIEVSGYLLPASK
jgi:hypothetical protein